MTNFIFPLSELNPAQVDEHFELQSNVCSNLAVVSTVDLDALEYENSRIFRRLPLGESNLAYYRGWMLNGEQYTKMAQLLSLRDVTLKTSPEQYLRAHQLPGWYKTFAHLTPKSEWLAANSTDEELIIAATQLNSTSFIIKDYVKSQKTHWNTACFASSIADVPRITKEFICLQENSLVGGIVVRAFENFVDKAEARAWWVDGELVTVTSHPDTPDITVKPILKGVEEAVRGLNCPFVTTDLALRSDGVWRVIEVGDGQVSDFPRGHDFAILASALSK